MFTLENWLIKIENASLFNLKQFLRSRLQIKSFWLRNRVYSYLMAIIIFNANCCIHVIRFITISSQVKSAAPFPFNDFVKYFKAINWQQCIAINARILIYNLNTRLNTWHNYIVFDVSDSHECLFVNANLGFLKNWHPHEEKACTLNLPFFIQFFFLNLPIIYLSFIL